MKSIKYIASVFGILVGLYLITMAIRQAFLARNLSLKPVGFHKNFIGFSDASITIFFEAGNTTDLDITLKNVKINVFINNEKATEIHRKNVHIPAGEKVITEAIIRFNPSEIFHDAADALLRFKDIPIRFKGHLDLVTNYFFWNRLKIDYITTLNELITA